MSDTLPGLTTEPAIPLPQPPESTRLASHVRRKNRYAQAFAQAGLPLEAEALRTCTTHSVLAGCTQCGKTWWVKAKCRMRVCPICSFKETKRRATFIERMSATVPHVRMLTLTLTRWEDEPRDGIKYLHKCWTKLRHRAVFKTVKGGVYQIELKRKPNGWHIHLHAVIESAYLPYQRVWSEWRKITGIDIPQIDIRAADNAKARAYVAKYAAKSAGFEDDSETVVEWWHATKGLRLWGTFGTWYRKDLEESEHPDQEEPQAPPCPHCGAEHSTFLARDGPRVFGHELWRTLEKCYVTAELDYHREREEWSTWLETERTKGKDHTECEPMLPLQ